MKYVKKMLFVIPLVLVGCTVDPLTFGSLVVNSVVSLYNVYQSLIVAVQ